MGPSAWSPPVGTLPQFLFLSWLAVSVGLVWLRWCVTLCPPGGRHQGGGHVQEISCGEGTREGDRKSLRAATARSQNVSTDGELLNQEEPVSLGMALPWYSHAQPWQWWWGGEAAAGHLPWHRHGRGSVGCPAAHPSSRAPGSIGGTCQVPPLALVIAKCPV